MSEQALVTAAVNSWKLNIERADRFFSPLTEEQLLKEVAPGKNRLIYLWGHLTAVHDRMLPLLVLGPRLHPEYDALFLTNPDKAAPTLPAAAEIKKAWMKSMALCSPALKAFRRQTGCKSTPLFRTKTLPKIRSAIAFPSC